MSLKPDIEFDKFWDFTVPTVMLGDSFKEQVADY
jgi:hypothetical protein